MDGSPRQQIQQLPQEAVGMWPPELEQLKTASAMGNLDVLQTILQEWQVDWTLSPALSAAVTNNQTAAVAYLLDKGVPMNQELFLYATEAKSYEILQAFLNHGWNINTPVSSLRPPALAYALNDEALTNWFLDHGADPNAPCDRDCTPLSWAVRYAPFSTIQLLFARGGMIQCGQLLHHAAEREVSDRLEVLAFLLERGASKSINSIMYQDCLEDYLRNMYSGIGTPLQLAAGKGYLDLVRFLVDRGADPLIKDPTGQIALDRALQGGHAEVVEFLRPLSIPSSMPRHDFVDGPGLHFNPMPLEDFMKTGEWQAVIFPQ